MSFMSNLGMGLALLSLSYVLFDYGASWWTYRRHGSWWHPRRVYRDLTPHRWDNSYGLYKINTVLVLVFVWANAALALLVALHYLARLLP